MHQTYPNQHKWCLMILLWHVLGNGRVHSLGKSLKLPDIVARLCWSLTAIQKGRNYHCFIDYCSQLLRSGMSSLDLVANVFLCSHRWSKEAMKIWKVIYLYNWLAIYVDVKGRVVIAWEWLLWFWSSEHWQLDRIFGVLMQKASLIVAGPLHSPTDLDIQNPAVNLQEFKWEKLNSSSNLHCRLISWVVRWKCICKPGR